MTRPPRLLAGLLIAACAGGASAANLLVNGGFDSPSIPAADSQYFNNGSAGITGWTVIGSNVQLVGSSFMGLSGSGGQWVDLTGGNEGYWKGVVSNAFATVAGQQYSISFDLGALTAAGYGPSTVSIGLNGVPFADRTNPAAIDNTFAMNWASQSVSFVGTGNPTTVSFLGSSNGGLANPNVIGLDNVAVAAVPEPHEWAMMLAGLALVGWVVRRRRGSDRAGSIRFAAA